MTKRLTEDQKKAYHEKGFVTGLPVFNADEVKEMDISLRELFKLLKPGEGHFAINGWHHGSRWLYDLCTTPQILDYVEDVLGPNVFLWGSQVFSKAPHS